MYRLLAIGGVLLAAAASGSRALIAQPSGFTRSVLQEQDLTVQGRRAVVARAEFAPGGAAGRHTHPGEELGYVLEGTVEIAVDGRQPAVLKAGDTFFIPAGVIHDGRNLGNVRAALVSTFVVEAGKPLASPAK
jgi:quercetin dioxygenase-like cupin family protein